MWYNYSEKKWELVSAKLKPSWTSFLPMVPDYYSYLVSFSFFSYFHEGVKEEDLHSETNQWLNFVFPEID